ncbi:efflux RND transporter permease subunit [Acinetobacter baumannii]|uniref:efflux RND transporter permease subunit n=1 Tax=Acinetobacter baumannii TaxID=470 RepID=UPI002447CE0B|nr:efflux RND transporter permease subunit [Acinetobacter baumannii]MDH2547073.1 efflux RND transporter permease subunit [Acinetobacter baumannii]MDH2641761.1 efflux RND transporter permease subunit [Acinetobacter baumannii]MDH2649251.1 efflux RND transporter permease subunit [Acinetobacter baumannii]MDV7631895.1 efflux RND transporter permease subunit [Acinetobacter baumannii]MDV7646319.1 efflux RND transporter permease subunit [Acinetobacter baumannii]
MKGFNLSSWGLQHRTLVIFAMLLSLLLGTVAYFKLGRAEDPNLTIKVMTIDVNWPGATTRDLEQQVVEKIQRTLQEVPNYDYVQSYVRPGQATIFLVLKDWTRKSQIEESWYQARKRVNDIRQNLPKDIQGPFFNDDFGDTFGSIYAFHADGFDDVKMKQVLLSTRDHLLQVPDVSKVMLLGIQEPRFYIEFNYAKLAQLGISPLDLVNDLQKQNAVESAGTFEGPHARIYARVDGDVKTVQDLKNIVVQVGSHNIHLGDVAHISKGFIDPPQISMRRNGERVTGLAVSMTEKGDILALGKQLDQRIKEVQEALPAGIIIEKIVDQPNLVEHSVNEFLGHFVLALAIVLAVSLFALGVRTGIVVALSVPLVLGITFFLMWRLDINLQRISLGALIIALGLLVDDAIIAVEMMQVKMEEGLDRFKAASSAWSSTAFPMLTGTLITAAGFVPVGFALSSTSEFTGSIFWVVGISLIVSWLVAVLFTPFLGTVLLPKIQAHGSHSSQHSYRDKLSQWFSHKIAWCVKNRKWVLLATVLSFILSLIAFQFVPQQFFPDSPREEILIDVQLEEGASYTATLNATKQVEKLLSNDQRVRDFTAYVGTGSPRFYLSLDPETPKNNYAQLIVYPKDIKQASQLTSDLHNRLTQQFPHIRTRVYRLELGPTVGYPVQFRVRGKDPEKVREIAGEVREIMRLHPNVRDVNFQWNERSKAIRFIIDQERARSLGISSQDISRTLQMLLSGYTVTQIREGTELIDVVARAKADNRLDTTQMGQIMIRASNGRNIPLDQVAELRPVLEEGGIWIRNRLPTLSVRADVNGAQAPDVSKQIVPLLNDLRKMLPIGYSIETGGTIEESAKADAAIQSVMPVMLLLWAIFLMVQLQSFSRMFMVVLTAPLGMIGVSLALLITRAPFGFVATLGVIALAGMIMRNSVILVDQIDRNISTGQTPEQAIIQATVGRTRPVLLTALAAILAMIPLTLSTLWGPMAIAIMGGLAVATVLTLFFVPALYAAWFRVKS